MAYRKHVPLVPSAAKALTEYEAALKDCLLATSTQERYSRHVRSYLSWLSKHLPRGASAALDDVKKRDDAVLLYAKYLRDSPAIRSTDTKRSRQPSSVNNTLSALDDFYQRRDLGPSPADREPVPRQRPRALEAAEIRAYLHASEKLAWQATDARLATTVRARAMRNRLLAELPYYAGLRISEIVALNLDDIRSVAGDRLFIRASHRPGAADRYVPIQPALMSHLNEWLQFRPYWPGAETTPTLLLGRSGRRVSSRTIYDAVNRVAAEAKLGPSHDKDPVSPQLLRDTLARRLLEQDTPVAVVAALLGHKSLDTTHLRTTPSHATLAAAIRKSDAQ